MEMVGHWHLKIELIDQLADKSVTLVDRVYESETLENGDYRSLALEDRPDE